MTFIARLRTGTAAVVRRRIAGPDFEAAHTRIFEAAGPRWFSPEDPIWRVHADASMFVGGIRALLLQSLHPRAMAAVAGPVATTTRSPASRHAVAWVARGNRWEA